MLRWVLLRKRGDDVQGMPLFLSLSSNGDPSTRRPNVMHPSQTVFSVIEPVTASMLRSSCRMVMNAAARSPAASTTAATDRRHDQRRGVRMVL